MDLERFYENLQLAHSVGISQLSVEPEEDTNQTLFRGVDDDQSIILFDRIDGRIVDYQMTIPSVKTFINRLNLFETLNVDFKEHFVAERLVSMKFQQGRRSVSYTFSDPDHLALPVTKPEMNLLSIVPFTDNQYAQYTSAINAMHTGVDETIFKSMNHEVYLELDSGPDTYCDYIADDGSDESSWKFQWRTKSFKTLVREALKTRDDGVIDIQISDKGLAYIHLGELEFILNIYSNK